MKLKLVFALISALALFMSANTSYAASRPSIAVADFKNATRAAWWNGGMGSEMASMLTNELGSVDRFRVVERNKLSHVIREQDLGASGRVNRRTAAKIGKLTGAHYLVMGTVSSYNEDTSSKGGGISFGGISIGGNSSKAYIAVDLRVVDTTTGEVEFVRTVEANSSGGGMKVGLHLNGVGANFGGKEKTPADKAIRACIVEITDYLACVMVDKDSCISEYKHKESRRRSKTRSAVELDE